MTKKEKLILENKERLILENFKRVSKQLGMLVENESNISELDITTYAKQMDNTESFPWTKFLSNDSDKDTNPRHFANKQRRVNQLSQERFESEFYKKFPKNSTTIDTSIGVLPFIGVKFNTNYTNYDLMFKNIKSEMGSIIFITYDNNNGYYIKDSFGDEPIRISKDSELLINDMLKYNISART